MWRPEGGGGDMGKGVDGGAEESTGPGEGDGASLIMKLKNDNSYNFRGKEGLG
jgi:hypothetical protein